MKAIPLKSILCALVLLSFSSASQAKPVSLVCEFPSSQLSLTFVFDPTTFARQKTAEYSHGHGTLVGNAGTEDVEAYLGNYAVSFVEPLATGVVQTTTIRTDTFEAIHSRHTILSAPVTGHDRKFVPSQAKGDCQLRD